MTIASRMGCGRAGWAAACAGALVACPLNLHADSPSDGGFTLRNQNPFLQVFGLPVFQSAELATSPRTRWNLALDLANHADFGETDTENFRIDGETYFLTLSMRRRVTARLEVGLDLPLLAHDRGFMDNGIEGWHDLFGMSNSRRRGPGNELAFVYQRDGADRFRLESPAAGIGDLQLGAAMPLRGSAEGGSRLTLRASLKLPTGDAGKLLGSGGTDASLGLYADTHRSLLDRRIELGGFAGGLLLGSGDVLPAQQKEVVAFGGMAATWHWTDRLAFAAQLYGQGPYFDSSVEELGGSSLQLAVGIRYRTRSDRVLRFAIVEDVSANATTDFALHFSLGGGT